MESMEEQFKQFEVDTRKNADAICEFCENSEMSVIEVGAACEWVVACIREAMRVIPDD